MTGLFWIIPYSPICCKQKSEMPTVAEFVSEGSECVGRNDATFVLFSSYNWKASFFVAHNDLHDNYEKNWETIGALEVKQHILIFAWTS